MSALDSQTRHLLLRAPLKELADSARMQRAHLAFASDEWQFYRGVEEAATTALSPIRAETRAATWLDHEEPAFREGYLAAMATIDAVAAVTQPPIRLALPAFRPR